MKEKTAIVINTSLLATGLVAVVQPPSQSEPAQRNPQKSQQEIDELSDSQNTANGELREDAKAPSGRTKRRKAHPQLRGLGDPLSLMLALGRR